jgi:diguanylate cyclase (GGDEF)-like protein
MRLLISFIIWALTSFLAFSFFASANEDFDATLAKMRAHTYDCPNDALFPELETLLSQDTLTQRQRFALSVAKGQFLICRGDYANALSLLQQQVAQDDIDKTSYAYASAIYQIGFVYDAQENPKRCEYYNEAQTLSSPQHHSDIFTSSSLNLITYCSASSDVGERLGKMFNVLERYSGVGSPGELAHIHNSIGLLYGSLGQHSLAAEQYLKAHEMGLQVYEGSNKLSILISAIVSLLSSGQIDEAYQRILEYGQLNSTIDTPLTNYHYQYALSFYYRKTRNYEQLAFTLADFKEAVSAVSSSLGQLFYNWHATEVCLYDNNLPCLQDYIESFEQGENYIPPRLRTNLDYLSFNLSLYLALGDIEKAKIAATALAKEVDRKFVKQQDSARVLSSATLYNKIYTLESEIEAAEKRRTNTLYLLGAIMTLLSGIIAFVFRRKFLASKAIDPATQLLNAETAIARINKLPAPKESRAIAIAIFDVSNLREITRQLGSTRADSVLRKISQTMQNATRGNDILGRFGTEQFILCLHNIEERSARTFFERVQNALNTTFETDATADHLNVESSMSIFISHEKIDGLNAVLDDMVVSLGMNQRQH